MSKLIALYFGTAFLAYGYDIIRTHQETNGLCRF